MPTLSHSTRDAHTIAGEALVLATVDTPQGPALAAGHGLPDEAGSHIASALGALDAKGRPDEVLRLVGVPGVAATTVVLTGLGTGTAQGTAYDAEVLRRAAGAALRSVARTAKKVAVALPGADAAAVGAVAEGAYAGCYRYDHKGTAGAGPAITVVSPSRSAAAKAAVERAAVLGARRAFAADLVNTPPNLLTPETFTARVRAEARRSTGKVTVSVMDEAALAKAGCGGIIGVGQGSANPPRIVTMAYKPARAKASVALVGKGITFDSGGLCIKPPASMLTMKCDMAGAAAVAATVLAAAELGVPVAVTGYLCLAENMPGGAAQRPGDVVTMRNKTTVEIIDTDAEGRMVLGDGLCLASEKHPDALLDIATLTGAATIALGDRIAGVMGNDDDFRTRVVAAANRGGEAAWAMPLPEDLRPALESAVADVAHKGGRPGGMLTAGLFLREFVGEGIPWAHLDIAGPAFNDHGPHGYTPKGATGYGVASLLGVIEDFS